MAARSTLAISNLTARVWSWSCQFTPQPSKPARRFHARSRLANLTQNIRTLSVPRLSFYSGRHNGGAGNFGRDSSEARDGHRDRTHTGRFGRGTDRARPRLNSRQLPL